MLKLIGKKIFTNLRSKICLSYSMAQSSVDCALIHMHYQALVDLIHMHYQADLICMHYQALVHLFHMHPGP